jgi:PiT family inorganic phosphate transporter
MLGALAIGVGVFTYSKRVMLTVGDGLMPMSPVAAWVVVVSHSIVLFLFASTGLEQLLANAGLPTIPLVPVSSSQAVVGAVVGIGLLKGGRQIKWRVLGNIGLGWMTTPVISSVLCFILLFFLQNVFNQQVYREVHFSLSPQVLLQLKEAKIDSDIFAEMQGKVYPSGVVFRDVLREYAQLSVAEEEKILSLAEISTTRIDRDKLHEVKTLLSEEQFMALAALVNEQFNYKWTLAKVLARSSDEWCLKDTTVINRGHNKQIKRKLKIVYRTFSVDARS